MACLDVLLNKSECLISVVLHCSSTQFPVNLNNKLGLGNNIRNLQMFAISELQTFFPV